MAEIGMTALFPLWKRETGRLAREMIAAGLRACLTCLDPKVMPTELAGHSFDESLLARLPRGVDPCGENGEFHTFAFAGPMFDRAIPVRRGETVLREGFLFTDLLL
jgi:diphthamide synthase (EF-2-diphthine--ammonia ligase)